MLHTYLKPHEAKQNDAGERLIGSELVSAPFVGSLQETEVKFAVDSAKSSENLGW